MDKSENTGAARALIGSKDKSADDGSAPATTKDVVQAPTGERPDDPHEGAPPPTEQLEDNSVESGTPSKGA